MVFPAATEDDSGFTLIELLTSIFIFALVISSVYGAYRATFFTVNGTEKQVVLASRARVILERITDDLESLYGGEDGSLQGEKGDIGGHRADSLECISAAHVRFTRSEHRAGLTLLKYTLEEQDSGLLNLYRLDAPLLPGSASPEDEDIGVLLGRGLQEFKVTYVSADGNESDEWQSQAEGSGTETEDEKTILLPALVRIEIRFADTADSEASVLFRTSVAIRQQAQADEGSEG
jgi:prepilin-type N-terminal cleavage/methylation domain-containing protein